MVSNPYMLIYLWVGDREEVKIRTSVVRTPHLVLLYRKETSRCQCPVAIGCLWVSRHITVIHPAIVQVFLMMSLAFIKNHKVR